MSRQMLSDGAPVFVVEDAGQANMARVYNALLGGRDNYARDREVAAAVAKATPLAVVGAKANRAFLGRAVTHLAHSGITQWLDLGAGLSSAGNVHEVAQRVNPQSRTIYVDCADPVVVAHARALLATDSRTIVVHDDIRDPVGILEDPGVRAHLDFSRPMAVLAVAVLHFLSDAEDPGGIVKTFRDARAPGSYLVITHGAELATAADGGIGPGAPLGSGSGEVDSMSAGIREAAALYAQLAAPVTLRTPGEIEALFTGLELLEPGIVPASLWRPAPRSGRGKREVLVAPVLAGVGYVVDGQREGMGARGDSTA